MALPNSRRIFFTADSQFTFKKVEGSNLPVLSGYALVWNSLSEERAGMKFRLLPNSAVFSNPTLALFHHDPKAILGNTANGTLHITPDAHGVRVEINLPETSLGRDVAELVSKKYLTGMSFAMASVPKGRAIMEGGQRIFEAESYSVDEVTITAAPAFGMASIDVKPETPSRTHHSLELERFKIESYRLSGGVVPLAAK